jgi:hypothetical protein
MLWKEVNMDKYQEFLSMRIGLDEQFEKFSGAFFYL